MSPDVLVVSRRLLQILAALVWYVGGVVLAWKGGSLLQEAGEISPGGSGPTAGAVAGVVIGSLKGIFLFRRGCRRNLERIDRIERPRIWQFFRPRFFLFLALMITFGVSLSRIAHGHYGGLIAVGVLDLTIAVALLLSSSVFWKRWIAARG